MVTRLYNWLYTKRELKEENDFCMMITLIIIEYALSKMGVAF